MIPLVKPRGVRRAPGRVTMESSDTVRKSGKASLLRREVEAMEYARRHTSIPIPAILKVDLDDRSDDDDGYILMERLPGIQLGDAWPQMSDEARSEAVRQLKSYMVQLQKLVCPSDAGDGPSWIGSVSGGPAFDHRLSNMTTCGPFASVADFHDFLAAPVLQSPRPDWVAKYRSQLPDACGICFAHADLSWENILLDPLTGHVGGILDWEMAGFWPAWWEFRKALFGSRCQPWWLELLKQIVVTDYSKETDVDMDLEMF